jgi:hypothetical protein
MFPFHKQSKSSLIRLVAVAILASFTWQLGSCPCGCFEHNAWVLLFVSSEHTEEADHDHQPDRHLEMDLQATDHMASWLLACEHNHERCIGGQISYIDNSRSDLLGGNSRSVILQVAGHLSIGHFRPTVPYTSQVTQHRSPVENPFQHSRSALQVYLI